MASWLLTEASSTNSILKNAFGWITFSSLHCLPRHLQELAFTSLM